MYRVELKDVEKVIPEPYFHYVPNVPCGVERILRISCCIATPPVPNVPCGVERHKISLYSLHLSLSVPNVPCGVERKGTAITLTIDHPFLMYRVELKGLKALQRYNIVIVPNVPCGVESYQLQ